MIQKHFIIYFVCLSALYGLICADATFWLFTKRNPTQPIVVSRQNASKLEYNKKDETVIIIHGYNSNASTPWLLSIKDAFLNKVNQSVNVFMVDWRLDAAGDDSQYPNAALEVAPEIGKQVAQFIKKINTDPKKLLCIGYSLGAHVCGFTGKNIKNEKKTLGRISALDPAGVLFPSLERSQRLDRTDADFVDVIHVDVLFGSLDPVGHADFYVNGGFFQPGCSPNEAFFSTVRSLDATLYNVTVAANALQSLTQAFTLLRVYSECSHRRAPYLYAESILSSCSFSALQCDSSFYYTLNPALQRCVRKGKMGYHASKDLRGKFYLETNSAQPFCLG